MRTAFLIVVIGPALLWAAGSAEQQPASMKVEIVVTDKATGKPLPCRMHVLDKAGKPQRAGTLPFWRDHFACPGSAVLNLSPGDYRYEIERGPEYAMAADTFTVTDNGPGRIAVVLERLADLSGEGWWSGELHVHRPIADIELLMRAEDLHVAPVISWWHNRKKNASEWTGAKPPPNPPLIRFDQNRYYHVLAGEDERAGGALLYCNLSRPLHLAGATNEYPCSLKYVEEARRDPEAWIDIEKPFWWDLAVWLSSGLLDSIGIANNHMCHGEMRDDEAWGKPRDRKRLPGPLGNGYWTQEIYYHILNCGLRLPPSAGSASGVLPNPVGYNRVYVHVDGAFSHEKWWQGLRAGHSFVTNGPLLRVQANDKLPGAVFTAPAGKTVDLEIKAALTAREKIQALEIIKNGRVERAVPYAEWQKTGGLGSLRFRESGWFLVRAIADNPKTFRFASTAPYYVEIGDTKRRISKSSALFFLEWAIERTGRVELNDLDQRAAVLRYHATARKFWEDMLSKANAE